MALTPEDRQWITEPLHELETRMDAKLERLETTLLGEFLKMGVAGRNALTNPCCDASRRHR
jgi:hypothetical protein